MQRPVAPLTGLVPARRSKTGRHNPVCCGVLINWKEDIGACNLIYGLKSLKVGQILNGWSGSYGQSLEPDFYSRLSHHFPCTMSLGDKVTSESSP